MKNLITSTIVFFTLLTSSYSQETFLKYIHGMEKISAVDRTYDGGYVIASYTNSLSMIIKTNRLGEIEWIKKAISPIVPYVISTSDSCIAALYEGNFYKMRINGDIIWSNQAGYVREPTITETHDKGYLLLGSKWMKFDKNGNIQWLNGASDLGRVLYLPLNDGNFIKCSMKETACYDSIGGLLWKKECSLGFQRNLAVSDDYFIISDMYRIIKISIAGAILSERPVTHFHYLCNAEENNFYLLDEINLIKVNSDLDTLWIKKPDFNFLPAFISSHSDSFIIAVSADGWFVRADTNGSYNALAITQPQQDKRILPGTHYNMQWVSRNVNKVNLYYSSNGNDWKVIKENIQNSGGFVWEVPDEYGDYYLKLNTPEIDYLSCISGCIHVHNNFPDDNINVNNVKLRIGNNDRGTDNGLSCLFWPSGELEKPAVFLDGLFWSGRISNQIYAGGTRDRPGLVTGKILENGLRDDERSYKYNIWKIRKNWESLPDDSLKQQLANNYKFWPAELGAPYEDVNADGKFSREIDKPRFTGDEVLWFTANDLDRSTNYLFGTQPIGIEVQVTTYAFKKNNELDDAVFKKYKILNKSGKAIEDMYISYWSDPDIGKRDDDFGGCDTLLNLGYCYNGDNDDEGYYGINPPAVGYNLLQGPIIFSTLSDTAKFNDKLIPGKRNLPMTSFNLLGFNTHSIYDTSIIRNLQYGKTYDGRVIIDPVSGRATKYVVPGDPVSGTGWYEGKGWAPEKIPPGDRQIQLNSGPFTMAPSDTQEVVFAIVLARGTNNISSIKELKRKSKLVQEFYETGNMTSRTEHPAVVYEYALEQNYPNPFNPSTTIRYSLPERTNVELKLYDVLGKEVVTLINEEKHKGSYQVNFTADKLSSGIYYYRLRTKDYISTRKMLLVK